jgi:hypothetical protein
MRKKNNATFIFGSTMSYESKKRKDAPSGSHSSGFKKRDASGSTNGYKMKKAALGSGKGGSNNKSNKRTPFWTNVNRKDEEVDYNKHVPERKITIHPDSVFPYPVLTVEDLRAHPEAVKLNPVVVSVNKRDRMSILLDDKTTQRRGLIIEHMSYSNYGVQEAPEDSNSQKNSDKDEEKDYVIVYNGRDNPTIVEIGNILYERVKAELRKHADQLVRYFDLQVKPEDLKITLSKVVRFPVKMKPNSIEKLTLKISPQMTSLNIIDTQNRLYEVSWNQFVGDCKENSSLQRAAFYLNKTQASHVDLTVKRDETSVYVNGSIILYQNSLSFIHPPPTKQEISRVLKINKVEQATSSLPVIPVSVQEEASKTPQAKTEESAGLSSSESPPPPPPPPSSGPSLPSPPSPTAPPSPPKTPDESKEESESADRESSGEAAEKEEEREDGREEEREPQEEEESVNQRFSGRKP